MADRVIRVVTLPVREIVFPEGVTVLDGFRRAWRLATDLSNWAQLELACRDARRTPDMERLPRYDRESMFGTVPRRFNRAAKGDAPARAAGEPKVNDLYGLFCQQYPDRAAWDGATESASSVLKWVEDTWRGHKSFGRFAVMWRGEARASVYGYPQPWRVPAGKGTRVRLSRDSSGRPHASFLLPGGRASVRLADGREFRRQLGQFDLLVKEPDRLKQIMATGRRAGGRLVGADVRIVGAFDLPPKGGDVGAVVRTGAGALLTAVVAGRDEPFIYHADDLPSVVAVHDDWSHRFATDLKHEKRWPASVRKKRVNGPRVQAKRDAARNRLRTARQTAAKVVVGFLTRQRVGSVVYNDEDKSFLPRFDWTGLRECVRHACEASGIVFTHVRGADDGE